jgi:hypothetical protein
VTRSLRLILRVISIRPLASLGTLTVCLMCMSTSARAQRAIPDDNLAYPVLVEVPGELASGFYLNTESSTYLVKAKHVLFDPQTARVRSGPMNLLSYPRNPKESATNVITVDLAALWQAGQIKGHPTADVAVVRIATLVAARPDQIPQTNPPPDKGSAPALRALQPVSGVSIHSSSHSGILGVAIEAVKTYDDVLVANDGSGLWLGLYLYTFMGLTRVKELCVI